jgi:CheY-like chemotaxis protein
MQYVESVLNRSVAGVAQIKLTDVKTPDETEPINFPNDRARKEGACLPQRYGQQGYLLMNTSTSQKYRILVVDDDLDLNTGFALLLEFDGHKVQTAYTAEAALAMLTKSPFDLLIAEYWLPRMRGDQLAAIVKRKWPDLPIIMVTANFEEIDVDDYPIQGVSCLLDKPFSMDQLRQAMEWAVGQHVQREVVESEVPWIHRGRSVTPENPNVPSESDDF